MSSAYRSINPSVYASTVSPGRNAIVAVQRAHRVIYREAHVLLEEVALRARLLDVAVCADDQRRRMPGVRHGHGVAAPVCDEVDHRHQLVEIVVVEQRVEPLQHPLRRGLDTDQGTDGRPDLRHCADGLNAAAHDIADEEGDPVIVERDDVVEVAADVGVTR